MKKINYKKVKLKNQFKKIKIFQEKIVYKNLNFLITKIKLNSLLIWLSVNFNRILAIQFLKVKFLLRKKIIMKIH